MKPMNQPAGEAMATDQSSISRRKLMLAFAAASTAAAVAVAPDAHGALLLAGSFSSDQMENPELIAAYQKFRDACASLKDAQESLEWLADEWRHKWPLAPEELLLGANAQDGRYTMPAERDIIGRYLVRDTSDLTKRLTSKFRRENRKSCFVIRTANDERERLERLSLSAPTGRTEKALVRNRALRIKAIRGCELRIQLAEQYEAETARLGQLSGADAALQRVKDADVAVLDAANDVSFLPSYTLAGLAMKAEALAPSAGKILEISAADRNGLGQIARFVKSVLQVSEDRS